MDPILEAFEDQVSTKYENMRKWRTTKNRCRKKVTPRKFGSLSEGPEAPGALAAPPRAPVLNKKQQFEQQKQQQQQQQLQQLWLNVDFCLVNCPIWVETCKKRMLNLVRVEGSMI